MEMDSSSRSRPFDRSTRDPATLKKPRLLAEEPTILRGNSNNPNGTRPLVQRQQPAGFRPAMEGDRDSESSDSTRGGGGGGYQPQSLSQTQIQQQHQELVSQYRTALAELTFNSKPIITNLTIIAGENLHAAKAIAATICSNILEVPNDQKLPSLYLLDSIVKNIGRDYIKHFAARLPEVFCKAYRQVDSAIHPGMRHLFGTWKGVFPAQSLQMIEKELGFTPAANGSSAGLTTSRSDQRPGRSIHVNPKYLEARQRQQQSGTGKGAAGDMSANLVNSLEDAERPDRTATNVTPGRPRADPRLKMHNIQHAQRNLGSDPVGENSSAAYGDFDYGSDILSPSETTSFGKSSERVVEQGSWYGLGSNTAETISSQRNGLAMKHGFSNYSGPRSAIADVKVQPTNNLASKRGAEVSRSWKNSEEEEYMWDDMNSRLAVPGQSNSSKRDPRLHLESERAGFENHLHKSQGIHDLGSRFDRELSSDSLSIEQKNQPAFRQRMLSLRSQGSTLTDGVGRLGSGRNLLDRGESFSTSFGGLSTPVNSLPKTSLHSQTGPSHIGAQSFGFNTLTGQPQHTLGAATPSGQAPVRQRPPSPSFPPYHPSKALHNIPEQDRPASHLLPNTDVKASRSLGQVNTGLPSQSPQDSFQMVMQNSQKPQPHNLLKPSTQLPLSHPKKHTPFLPSLQPEPISEPSGQSPKILPPQISVSANSLVSSSLDHSKSLVADIPGTSSSSNVLAAVSNIFGNKSIIGNAADASSQSETPPLPSGPHPTQVASSGSRVMSSHISPSFHESTLLSASISQRKADRPPLPPVAPPSGVSTMSTQTSNVVNAASNPVSSLLSTLVAKGLISTSKSDSPSSGPTPAKSQSLKNESPIAQVVSPILGSSELSKLPTKDESSRSKPAAKSTVAEPSSTEAQIKSLIGFEFKPDVIRESHPAVICELIDDLPHQCSICGLRFKLEERFDRHVEWHTSRNFELSTPSKASRGWFANSDNWVKGTPDLPLSDEATDLMDSTEEPIEIDGEQMVTADESQCVCILCGELFEDFYDQERDKWMFKGATYLRIDGKVGIISDDANGGPIVHSNCISDRSLSDLGVANDLKAEKDV